jgi:hypothetical protein
MPRRKGKNDYSEDFRDLIIKHYQNGESLATIGQYFLCQNPQFIPLCKNSRK